MSEVFTLIPPGQKSFWFMGFTLLIPLAILLGVFFFTWQSSRASFILTREKLEIQAMPYGRTILRSDLVREQAEVIDLTARPDLQLKFRTNGIGLPGLQIGWYRLKNKSKALVFISRSGDVVYVPTRKGYALLFSIRDADRFVRALKS